MAAGRLQIIKRALKNSKKKKKSLSHHNFRKNTILTSWKNIIYRFIGLSDWFCRLGWPRRGCNAASGYQGGPRFLQSVCWQNFRMDKNQKWSRSTWRINQSTYVHSGSPMCVFLEAELLWELWPKYGQLLLWHYSRTGHWEGHLYLFRGILCAKVTHWPVGRLRGITEYEDLYPGLWWIQGGCDILV